MRKISKGNFGLVAGLFLALVLAACSSDSSAPAPPPDTVFVDEGTEAAPIVITLADFPRISQVGPETSAITGISWYHATDLAPITTYTITVTEMTADVVLRVNLSSFSGPIGCESNQRDLGNESCSTMTGSPTGELFITVADFILSEPVGTAFVLDVL